MPDDISGRNLRDVLAKEPGLEARMVERENFLGALVDVDEQGRSEAAAVAEAG